VSKHLRPVVDYVQDEQGSNSILTSEQPNMNQNVDAPHNDTQFLKVKCLDLLSFHLPMF
jgi:hypothetical protein